MENKKAKFLYIFLMLQPFIDLVTSLMTRIWDIPITVGLVLRGLFLIILVIYNFFFVKNNNKRFITYMVLVLVFLGLFFITKPELLSIKFLKTEITYIFKYFYFPIISACLINCYKKLNLNKEKLNKILIINAVVYAVLIIIPTITQTSFSSYGSSGKGSVGWFYAANEIGATLVVLFSYIYILNHKKDDKKFVIYIMLMMFAMMIIGTKVAFVGMLLTEIVFLIYYLVKKDKLNRIIPAAVVLLVSLSMVPFLPVTSNLEDSITNNEFSEDIDKSSLTYKVLNVVLSGRQDFAYNTYKIVEKSPKIDGLFGIGFSNRSNINNKKITKLTEIDFLDIYFHYGIVGFLIYIIPILYIIHIALKHLVKKKLHFKFYELLYLYTILLLLGVSSLAGHVTGAPPVSIYIALTLAALHKEIKSNKIKENEITILALHLGYGGVEKYISSLCKMLGNDYKINIISTYKVLDKPAFDFDKKIKITYLINDKPNKEEFKETIKSKNIIKILVEGLKSIKILWLRKFKNMDAIEQIDSQYIITTRTFHNDLVSKYANSEIIKIATEHNYHNNDKKYINKLIKSLNNFDYMVVVSNTLKNFYKNKIGNTKCVYIPNVIDKLPDKYTKLKENNLINIGRLEYEKAHTDLIDVIYDVKKEIPNIKLYLIGDGSKKQELEDKIKSLSLEENIILTGYLDQTEIEKYLVKSKLFVMTSLTESFGLVLIEAMSYKVPCIAYDSADGAKELLKNGNGVLIKNRSKKSMVKEIINLLSDKNKLIELSKTGHQSCKEYLIDNVTREWLELLSEEEECNENKKN